MLKGFLLACLAGFLAAPLGPARAGDSMSFVYHRDDSGQDVHNRYLWRVIHEALERTRPDFGDYDLQPSRLMRETSRAYVLEHGVGGINFSVIPYQPELEAQFIRVPITVDRGVLGYRVLLIREAEQHRFDRIKTARDLRSVRFGLMDSWVATGVLRGDGFEVLGGTSYDGLFHMLAAGRFDAFDRSIGEVIPEYDSRKAELPGVVIERHLLLHYTMPGYFWFPKTTEGRRRAERMELGLKQMVEDGTLRKMFDEEFGPDIRRLDLEHRRVIELPNPILSPKQSFADQSLWYRPGEKAE